MKLKQGSSSGEGEPLTYLKVSAPGRVCLFGEHQDYLGLPVIPCAISLRISVAGKRRNDTVIILDLPDIKSTERFLVDESHRYVRERDYFRSAVNVLRRHGHTFSTGFDCEVRGDIPINSGTSSSSALIVAWVNFLTHMSDQNHSLDPKEAARLAHEAEVLEFGEPGGMMDQYSTACGGILHLEFQPEVKVEVLEANVKPFILGDSHEPKKTKEILARVKNRVLDIARRLSESENGFSLDTVATETLDRFSKRLTPEELALLVGTVRNRDITREARLALVSAPLDHKKIGALLWEHQSILRDVLHISTTKIDRMLDAAMEAGAFGGKINGSGGGGCMFAYAPESPELVREAVERSGGKGYVVVKDSGVRIESPGGWN